MRRNQDSDDIKELAPLLNALSADPKTVRYYKELVKPLRTYDQEHFGDLTKTLATYLNNSRNATRTADALFIHRNSLRYRLQRIKMLVSLDPDDSGEGLALQIALLLSGEDE